MEVMGKSSMGALEAFVSPGWSVLWRELMIWQTEASEALPSEHWATVHAALLVSYLAMRRRAFHCRSSPGATGGGGCEARNDGEISMKHEDFTQTHVHLLVYHTIND